MTRFDILPPDQRRLLPELAPLIGLGFVLYGGTAIALRLGHRVSIDFDFFSERPMDRDAMRDAVRFLVGAVTLQDDINTWTIQTRPTGPSERPVKVSFFAGLRFGRVGTPSLTDDGEMLLASPDDLLGHKLKVLLQRVEAKDYRDIVALLGSGLSLERGIAAALGLFPGLPAGEVLKALVYFEGGNLGEVTTTERSILIRHADRFTTTKPMPLLALTLGTETGPRT